MKTITTLNDRSRLSGTSFHGYTLNIKPNNLITLFGPYENPKDGKVQTEWDLLYDNIPFSIYDWKEYEDFEFDKVIEYHIGTHTEKESEIVYNAIIAYIIEYGYKDQIYRSIK